MYFCHPSQLFLDYKPFLPTICSYAILRNHPLTINPSGQPSYAHSYTTDICEMGILSRNGVEIVIHDFENVFCFFQIIVFQHYSITPMFDGIFFLGLNTPPFLNRQFRLSRFPARQIWILNRNRGCATSRIGTEDVVIHLILMKNGSAALSILNKVCNSIQCKMATTKIAVYALAIILILKHVLQYLSQIFVV
jgi:hypothetical protein